MGGLGCASAGEGWTQAAWWLDGPAHGRDGAGLAGGQEAAWDPPTLWRPELLPSWCKGLRQRAPPSFLWSPPQPLPHMLAAAPHLAPSRRSQPAPPVSAGRGNTAPYTRRPRHQPEVEAKVPAGLEVLGSLPG